jgi:hypothetical protein
VPRAVIAPTRCLPRHARHLTEEFTEREKGMAAELYARAHELHRLNQELRQAHTRERQVAVALQEAMLSAPDLLYRLPARRFDITFDDRLSAARQ